MVGNGGNVGAKRVVGVPKERAVSLPSDCLGQDRGVKERSDEAVSVSRGRDGSRGPRGRTNIYLGGGNVSKTVPRDSSTKKGDKDRGQVCQRARPLGLAWGGRARSERWRKDKVLETIGLPCPDGACS